MIVWLASYPRSGNTLVRAVLYYGYGIRSGSVHPEKGSAEGHTVQDDISLRLDPERIDEHMETDELVFVKTHMVADPDDPSPAIYIVRDGRDTVASFANFAKARPEPLFKNLDHEATLDALIDRDRPYGGWSGNARSWRKRTGPTAIVPFERLIEDPGRVVRDAVEAVGVPLPELSGHIPSFDELHERNPKMFRKGRVGAYRSEMSSEQLKRFWRRHGVEMLLMGYAPDRDEGAAEDVRSEVPEQAAAAANPVNT